VTHFFKSVKSSAVKVDEATASSSSSLSSSLKILGVADDGECASFMALLVSLLTKLSVPVVDAQDEHFRLPKDIKHLHRFDRFEGPIPVGSLVMAGFAVSKYKAKERPKDATVDHNLLFVAVLKAA
jgi:hypothetical protein